MEMSNADQARTFFAAYDRHDVDGMLACCTPDATFEYVPYGEQGKGRMQDAAMIWRGLIDAFPDFSVSLQNIMETNDGTVIVETIQGGTQAKDVMGIANLGRAQHTPHVFIVRFDDNGRIAHLKGYWDNDTIFTQLGHTQPHS
jgi:steroid delta-isomerase-like uncharacterized protein